MKKIILLISLLTILIGSINAQDQKSISEPHMDFKGIPIDGPLNSFVQKLQGKGFIKDSNVGDDIVIMKGEFANEDTFLYILASSKTKTVWKVCVEFPKISTWSTLKMKYFEFKDLYTKKYGEPQSYEFFSSPYKEGDGYEMNAVNSEKCTHSSYFKIKEGYIAIDMAKKGAIEISYEDAQNNDLRKKEKENKILNDI